MGAGQLTQGERNRDEEGERVTSQRKNNLETRQYRGDDPYKVLSLYCMKY